MATPKKPPFYFNDQGSVTVDLPCAKTSIILRRPKARDLKVLDNFSGQGEFELMIKLIATLADKTIDEVEDTDAEDLGVMGEALKLFPVFSKRNA